MSPARDHPAWTYSKGTVDKSDGVRLDDCFHQCESCLGTDIGLAGLCRPRPGASFDVHRQQVGQGGDAFTNRKALMFVFPVRDGHECLVH